MRRPQTVCACVMDPSGSNRLRSSPRKRGSRQQHVSHSVRPWVPACVGTNGFLLCACHIFLGPRLRGDERLGRDPGTLLRSSPRKRGSSRQYVSQFVRPWVPACAGTNGFLLDACAIFLGPRLRGDERLGDEASTSPRSSPRKRGSSRQYVSHSVWPWVPACAGTNGFLLGACAIFLGPRFRGDERLGRDPGTLLRSSPRKRGSSQEYVGHPVWPWVPACAGTNGFLLCACHIFLGPRLRGDERLGRDPGTLLRSSPYPGPAFGWPEPRLQRGSSRQYVSQFVWP